VVTPPRVEPVTLSEAKEHLRILPENAEDDAYVQGLISAGRRIIESRLGITMVATQYRAKVCGNAGRGCSCCCSDRGIQLPHPPLLVDADHPITVETEDGEVMTYPPVERRSRRAAAPGPAFEVDPDQRPAVLIPRRGWRGPATITYWAGLPPAAPQPATLKNALLLMVGHLYKHREAVTTDGSAFVLPMGFDALVAAESWSGRF
jgi:uncharacterized phiE125 gp8 family phage protein